jgi:hypothetical protein
MEIIQINTEFLEYNKVIYVDAVNGNDANSGTINAPVSSFGKAIDLVTNNNKEAIYLMNTGDYHFDKTRSWADVSEIYMAGVDIIGDGTKILIEDVADNFSHPFNEVNFYQLIFEVDSSFPEGQYTTGETRTTVFFEHGQAMKFNFFNCVFSDPHNLLTDNFIALDWATSTSPIYTEGYSDFINCSFLTNDRIPIKDYSGYTDRSKLINCSTTAASLSHYDNIQIVSFMNNCTYDDDYNITSSGWENAGTGINPDGTQIHIGIYGGTYAWGRWVEDALLEHNSNIYTFNGSFIQTILSRPLTKEEFEANSFNPSELTELDWNNFTDMIYDAPFNVITMTDKSEINANVTYEVNSSAVYQISKDELNWYGYDGTWKDDYYMTKAEVESLTGDQLKELTDRIHINESIYYKVYMSSNSDTIKPLVKLINTRFTENQAPIIVDFDVSPDEIYNNHVEVTGKLVDLEGDDIEYRISILKASNLSPNSEDAVPTMTSATSPEGEVTSSGDYNSDYSNYKAFNDVNIYNNDGWLGARDDTTPWIQYKFNEAKRIWKYTLTPRGDGNHTFPEEHQLKASNDGINWTTLHEVTNVTQWLQSETKVFEIADNNRNEYQYYRIKINKTYTGLNYVGFGEIEFLEEVMTYDVVDDWAPKSNGDTFLRAYDTTYFDLGENKIKVEARDEKGLISNPYEATIVFINEAPTINYSFNEFRIHGEIGDSEGDNVAWRLLINGTVKKDWTYYGSSPMDFDYSWDDDDINFGIMNTITIEAKDIHEQICSTSFEVEGKYKGILFIDEDDNYYINGDGIQLKDLTLEKIIAGQNTNPKKIKMINQSGYPLEDVKLKAANGTLPENAELYLNFSGAPFVPNKILELGNVLGHDEIREFHIQVSSGLGEGGKGRKFHVDGEGTMVTS